MNQDNSKISVHPKLLLAQKIANITDTAVRIPFTKLKFGLDFLIGLIPGIGDTIMLFVSISIIYLGKDMGLPKSHIMRMIRNSVIDYFLGLLPLIGDIADLFYKANKANVRIMEKYWLEQNRHLLSSHTQQQLADWESHKGN